MSQGGRELPSYNMLAIPGLLSGVLWVGVNPLKPTCHGISASCTNIALRASVRPGPLEEVFPSSMLCSLTGLALCG